MAALSGPVIRTEAAQTRKDTAMRSAASIEQLFMPRIEHPCPPGHLGVPCRPGTLSMFPVTHHIVAWSPCLGGTDGRKP